ncbi:hypothetical protein [Rubritalea tangerina]|uniref:hypothetical protein n=1 Tax=Rubritalea tangerina TaxID=430798 RepID=UPI003614C5C8
MRRGWIVGLELAVLVFFGFSTSFISPKRISPSCFGELRFELFASLLVDGGGE